MTDAASTPSDIGDQIGEQLAAWRPETNAEDVVQAIMVAIEHYSIHTEVPSETGLRTILFGLKDRIDARIQSL